MLRGYEYALVIWCNFEVECVSMCEKNETKSKIQNRFMRICVCPDGQKFLKVPEENKIADRDKTECVPMTETCIVLLCDACFLET